jgi:Nucleoside 2-deoxyribosyltransferase/pfkB family carbohydrate kinase
MHDNILNIVGGTYLEYCIYPEWSQLYGSGLRSTIALSQFGADLKFFTYVGKNKHKILERLSSTYGFELSTKIIPETITFDYLYPLSSPYIYPNSDDIKSHKPIKIKGKNILRFGFIEGDGIVEGERVVYDPQSPNNPIPFNLNGSKASQLVIILNLDEAQKLSGIELDQNYSYRDLKQICNRIIKQNSAYAVIIKNGPEGAFIYSDNVLHYKPPIFTKSVWLLGSGDIFTSVFAYYWTVKKRSILKSVDKAIEATAFYCGSKVLPSPDLISKGLKSKPIQIKKRKIFNKKPIYLAGPFFDISQLWFVNEVLAKLSKFGLKVFSPFHDVKLIDNVSVAKEDIESLKNSSLLFAILDGSDSGTLFEIGYARALNIPVIVYASSIKDKRLTMLEGTGCKIYTDLSTALYHTYWKLMKS